MEEIEAITGPVRHGAPVEDRPQAPGQLRHHYAPRKPLALVADATGIPQRDDVGWLAFGPAAGAESFPGVVANVSPTGNLREAAAHFFRTLRALDDDPRVSEIVATRFPGIGLALALNERLERAAASV